MIGCTLPEIRRLLISLVQACAPDPDKDRKTSNILLYQVWSDVLHGSRVLLDDIDDLFNMSLHAESFEFYMNYNICGKLILSGEMPAAVRRSR